MGELLSMPASSAVERSGGVIQSSAFQAALQRILQRGARFEERSISLSNIHTRIYI